MDAWHAGGLEQVSMGISPLAHVPEVNARRDFCYAEKPNSNCCILVDAVKCLRVLALAPAPAQPLLEVIGRPKEAMLRFITFLGLTITL